MFQLAVVPFQDEGQARLHVCVRRRAVHVLEVACTGLADECIGGGTSVGRGSDMITFKLLVRV